jgi:hypothetical protein
MNVFLKLPFRFKGKFLLAGACVARSIPLNVVKLQLRALFALGIQYPDFRPDFRGIPSL